MAYSALNVLTIDGRNCFWGKSGVLGSPQGRGFVPILLFFICPIWTQCKKFLKPQSYYSQHLLHEDFCTWLLDYVSIFYNNLFSSFTLDFGKYTAVKRSDWHKMGLWCHDSTWAYVTSFLFTLFSISLSLILIPVFSALDVNLKSNVLSLTLLWECQSAPVAMHWTHGRRAFLIPLYAFCFLLFLFYFFAWDFCRAFACF